MKIIAMIRYLMLSLILLLPCSWIVFANETLDSHVVHKAQQNITVKTVRQKAVLQTDAEILKEANKKAEQSSAAAIAIHSDDEWKNQLNMKLWEIYKKGDITAVGSFIAEQKKLHPTWQEPEKIKTLAGLLKVDKELFAARKDGDYQKALTLYKTTPQAFSCESLGWVMFLAEAQMRNGQKKQAVHSYEQALSTCSNDAKVALLESALGVLLIDDWQRLMKYEYQHGHYKGENKKRLDLLWYKLKLQELQYASDHEQEQQAVLLANKIEPSVMKYDDDNAAEIVGWTYLRVGLYAKALKYFDFAYQRNGEADALRGKALSLGGAGLFSELDALIVAHRSVFEEKGLMKDVLPLMAGHTFKMKEYEKTLSLLVDLKKLRPLKMSELNLLAWSKYHIKEFSEAAETFEVLYRIKPDDEVARGLYYSLLKMNDERKMDALSEELGGAFSEFVEREKARGFYQKDQFLAARARSNLYSSVLNNITEPFVRLSFMGRDTPGTTAAGTANFSRVNLRKTIVEFRDVFSDINELSLRIESLKLNAGESLLPPAAEVGTVAGGAYVQPKPQTIHKGYEWSLAYRHEDEGTIYGEIGQVNIPDAIHKNAWKFRLGYARSFGEQSFQLEGYRQPLRESGLSYVGMVDPYLGVQRWGQVSRNGVNLSLYQALPLKLSLNANLVGEKRTGYSVKDNNYYSAYLGLPYTISSENLEYFSVSPYIRREHSQMDQNHFTVGHGGYYSPQFLMDTGIGMNVLTKTKKAWMLSLSGSIGRQHVRTSLSPKLPLLAGNALAPYAITNNRETHYQVDIATVLALTKHWRFNAEYRFERSWSSALNATKAYQDRVFMLGLTYHFSERSKQLLRSDIPSYGLQALY